LLTELRYFPHVPDKILFHAVMLPPILHQDGHYISGRDSAGLPSLVIDTSPETVLNDLPSEGDGDATKDFLDASRILRGYVRHQTSKCFRFDRCSPNFQSQASRVGDGTL